ncbi:1-(5-phosphoribosyl)-5-[(5-phosphoribosylamino)methylideneamino]imidazole-4-carboxamide isomerase [Ruminiclostridium cellulolyticum]|uniref:1-(5-phosphoribosyl)-5-[(5-phosphoribosylamino)methylideneamino] imidazole-4-carboxamide isomerase n=1 Tax=Ruminiclostridium cellulolyticum (strain ATCC 35319 / DSM 5812 / JCM 6584 / H10) TaxID=394503 RepID=HIS4_RUMCH|nr:1-(5-phosphoribosyl)-5-[(5-phosphoribosylamino)methylideneamino]imidazole-4-carboxamide isomerase [Ruminiclostridium cellulolyticum]B8I5V5.1 RecName: Full=1-(5-phosphoribosyl)-5-[(5-phosphoribosylamino)methylideneamino] imidazole-4-carboxamide isomerase; AltName: Full=Phosphoribosylformimino-5-aminoimidazole carboxamide ribotide isomerase [Ruminiclostridium cellulolyticum H10]ACL74772.1 phosphoribosylformimino-5-aminoimidazole carboxamide ribotide isomerase [Ruminiclostridium cellulolyticum H1
MIIYPAIDIIDGKCVRLQQGSYSDVTVFGDSPVDMARKWESLGAGYLHVVDLDGARSGKSENAEIIKQIAKTLKIPVQTGGGIRNLETVETYLSGGLSRIILGTSAVSNREMLISALKEYKGKIAVGIDAKDGKVAIHGWEKTSDYTAVEFAKEVESLGAKTIIYTDISRDGMLKGPNLQAMKEMADSVSMDVIASGGVSRLKDIIDLKQTGVSGVIVGKAIYTGNVDLKEAILAI